MNIHEYQAKQCCASRGADAAASSLLGRKRGKAATDLASPWSSQARSTPWPRQGRGVKVVKSVDDMRRSEAPARPTLVTHQTGPTVNRCRLYIEEAPDRQGVLSGRCWSTALARGLRSGVDCRPADIERSRTTRPEIVTSPVRSGDQYLPHHGAALSRRLGWIAICRSR